MMPKIIVYRLKSHRKSTPEDLFQTLLQEDILNIYDMNHCSDNY